MPKLQKSQARYSITLNAKIVNLLGWKKGDEIELKSDLKGRLYLARK
jgi:hypothetical protein